MKLQTVIFRIKKIQTKIKYKYANKNTCVKSSVAHGKVLEPTFRKSVVVSSKPKRYVSNFTNRGKECNIQKLLNGIEKLLNDIQNIIC